MRFRLAALPATIIASVGCPMGCNFCTTSAFFGGKGKVLNWYSTGEERFRLMSENAPVMIWMSTPTGGCLHLNRMLREF